MDVNAPMETLWRLLTDYGRLSDIVPGLAENREIESFPGGCRLLQVGRQDLALGFAFSARCIMNIREHPQGIPDRLLSWSGRPNPRVHGRGRLRPPPSLLDGSVFPAPRSQLGPAHPYADIAFESTEGDFQIFKGLWRLQARTDAHAHLSYSVFVRPHIWLPVQLVQARIEQEIRNNMHALRNHAATLPRRK